jgi:DNA mismatch repair ATPase MutS
LQDSDGDEREVVFLYKLKAGPTESSFGLNVAKMAGLPEPILTMAATLAHEFEKKMTT